MLDFQRVTIVVARGYQPPLTMIITGSDGDEIETVNKYGEANKFDRFTTNHTGGLYMVNVVNMVNTQ